MALDTYDNMKATVRDYLARGDLDDRIPDFIRLAETKINRELRDDSMEFVANADLVAGQTHYSLPNSFISMRTVWIDGSPNVKLEYRTPHQMMQEYGYGNSPPNCYTIQAGCIVLNGSPADQAQGLIMNYLKRYDFLSETNVTNWLLEEAPDLVLYGALLEATPFIKDDDRLLVWGQMFAGAMKGANKQAQDKRFGGDILEIRSTGR